MDDRIKEFNNLVIYARRLLELAKRATTSEKVFIANNLFNVLNKLLEYKVIKNVNVENIRKKLKSQIPIANIINDISKIISDIGLSD